MKKILVLMDEERLQRWKFPLNYLESGEGRKYALQITRIVLDDQELESILASCKGKDAVILYTWREHKLKALVDAIRGKYPKLAIGVESFQGSNSIRTDFRIEMPWTIDEMDDTAEVIKNATRRKN